MNLSFSKQEPPDYPPQILLASQSIGRKTLLEKLGVHFRVVVSRVDEDAISETTPEKTILRRAQTKANEVAGHPKVYMIPDPGKTLLITADSEAVLGKKMYGKADDREHAKAMVRELAGKTHAFMTAIVVVHIEHGKEKKRWEKVVTTKVTLGKLSGPELDQYIARYDFARFAGGYSINEAPWDLVTKIEGSYTNVVGLPFEVLLPILRSVKILV